MHKIISECSAEAKQTGARIVFSCGFDSIPFDLGVLFVQEEVMSRLNKYAPSVRGRVRDMNGEFSGGTAASMKATMAIVAFIDAAVPPENSPFISLTLPLTEGAYLLSLDITSS